jgi:predicted HTH transcriptional regulator
MDVLIFVAGVLVGAVAVYFLIKPKSVKSESGIVVRDYDVEKKQANLAKILEALGGKQDGRITNDEIESLLGVSDTTVGRYLDDLELSGKITQHGDTGSGVYYTKK